MIPHILKQLWAKRRANAWIMLELILVTFFLWGVLDPVYVLLSNRALPDGYDANNVLRLYVGQYDSSHSRFRAEHDTDSARREDFLRIYRMVKEYPGVEYAAITCNTQYPLSQSMSSQTYYRDTLKSDALLMNFYHDGDYFHVFRIHDINTGSIPETRNPAERSIYLSQKMATNLFPEGSATGKQVHKGDSTNLFTVAGVVPDLKFRPGDEPRATEYTPMENFPASEFPWSAQVCFRIREGLSSPVFAEQFKQELTQRMSVGNLYFLNLTNFDVIRANISYEAGDTNKLRLQAGLALFFLICTFLGIAGNFWVRADARRAEIGLRMALGAGRKRILTEFFMESWLLTTVAWLIGILAVLQRVYFTGFAEGFWQSNPAYLHNQFVPHFLIVSAIVYVFMLFITFMGTWIPASRAAKTEPANALHEE